MSDLTVFNEIVADLPMPTMWQTAFEAAEEQLQAELPEGFNPRLIGQVAWEQLPEGAEEKARDELFYVYWAAQDREELELARWEREKESRAKRQLLLEEFGRLADGSRPVPYALLADIVRLTYQLNGGGER